MEQNDSIESLVRAARNGDRTAFKNLYNRFHKSVYRMAYRLTGDRMYAEDVTQEVFLKIYQKLNGFNLDSSFRTWSYRITVNHCYDRMRKQKRRGRYDEGPVEPGSYESGLKSSKSSRPDEVLSRKEFSEQVDRLLQSVPEDLRTAFVLREFEQLSYSDIAEVLGCSEGTVASRLARARGQLAENLIRLGIDRLYF